MSCTCPSAPVPYNHHTVVSAKCPEHGVKELFDLDAAALRVEKQSQSSLACLQLVAKGWRREGAGWTHPKGHSHLSQAKAYATLLWEEGRG